MERHLPSRLGLILCSLWLSACTDGKPELLESVANSILTPVLQNNSTSMTIPITATTDVVTVSGTCDARVSQFEVMTETHSAWVTPGTFASGSPDLDCTDRTFSFSFIAGNEFAFSPTNYGVLRIRAFANNFASGESYVTINLSGGATVPALYGILNHDGLVLNASQLPFVADYSNPRNFCFYKTDTEQTLGAGGYACREGGHVNSSPSGVYISTLDPRVVSMSVKPDTGDMWGLTSYGRVVRILATGQLDFATACVFAAGCNGYVRFDSMSAGQGTALYLMDHEGQVFEANNLITPVATLGPRARHFVYY